MSGLLFPAVRVKFSLATLVRHTHERYRIASNSHSVRAACPSSITPPSRCVKQHPGRKDRNASEPNTLLITPKNDCAHSFTFPPHLLMSVSFRLVLNFTRGENANARTVKLVLEARTHTRKTPRQFLYQVYEAQQRIRGGTSTPPRVKRTHTNGNLK